MRLDEVPAPCPPHRDLPTFNIAEPMKSSDKGMELQSSTLAAHRADAPQNLREALKTLKTLKTLS